MDPTEPVPQRIGDAERDFAVEQLQEHHSLGRLDAAEFDERMSRALQARTGAELAALFTDLPGPNPGAPFPEAAPAPVPALTPASFHTPEPPAAPLPGIPTPWYAQWWMILVAVGITMVSRGNAGPLIPMMAIWIWVIYPSIAKSRRSSQVAGYAPRRSLNEWQRQQVLGELGMGRRTNAVDLYRQFTGAGLADANREVEQLQRQLGGRGY